MSPCVEHYLRFFTADRLSFPYTLLLTNNTDDSKMVVGVKKSIKSGFIVKHWLLSQTTEKDDLPVLKKCTVNTKEELLSSDKIVIPGYRTLAFKEVSAKNEVQEATGPYAKMQEKQYQQDLDSVLYPDVHRNFRMNWLWKEYCLIQKIPDYQHNMRLFTLKSGARRTPVWKKWLTWKRYLLQSKDIAPELYYYNAYKAWKYHVNMQKNKAKWFAPASPIDHMVISYTFSTNISGTMPANTFIVN